MINKNSNIYTFIFALIVCVVCSFFLALVSEGLRPKREMNEAYDMKKNILSVVEFRKMRKESSALDVMDMYQEVIEEIVINAKGDIVEGKTHEDIKDGENVYPLYIYRERGDIISYVFPVYGKGAWSTIYGFLGLEADAVTIRGMIFYKHGETPGLGGKVSSRLFQRSFKGKKIYDAVEGRMRPVQIIKGEVAEKLTGREADFAVDGITGATKTCKGVSGFLNKWIRVYEPYFQKIRKNKFE